MNLIDMILEPRILVQLTLFIPVKREYQQELLHEDITPCVSINLSNRVEKKVWYTTTHSNMKYIAIPWFLLPKSTTQSSWYQTYKLWLVDNAHPEQFRIPYSSTAVRIIYKIYSQTSLSRTRWNYFKTSRYPCIRNIADKIR